MPPFKDRIGQTFGRLTVIDYAPSRYRSVQWKCRCICGTIITTKIGVGKGYAQSCGCLQREIAVENASKPDINPACTKIYATYRSNAHNQNRVFDIPKDVFTTLVSLPCYYCNAPPNRAWKHYGKAINTFFANGLDRVDNEKGYTIDNVVTCCMRCNKAKGTLTQTSFIEMCKLVASFH